MSLDANTVSIHIEIWKEALSSHETAYNNAVTHDDRGAKEFSQEMIKYSQKRIDELEDRLIKLKKGA